MPTLAVRVAVLGMILGLGRVDKAARRAHRGRRRDRRSYALDLASHGVSTLGTVPGGLPSLGFPNDSNDDATSRTCSRRPSRSSW